MVIVAGGTGSLGQNLANKIANRGDEMVMLTRVIGVEQCAPNDGITWPCAQSRRVVGG